MGWLWDLSCHFRGAGCPPLAPQLPGGEEGGSDAAPGTLPSPFPRLWSAQIPEGSLTWCPSRPGPLSPVLDQLEPSRISGGEEASGTPSFTEGNWAPPQPTPTSQEGKQRLWICKTHFPCSCLGTLLDPSALCLALPWGCGPPWTHQGKEKGRRQVWPSGFGCGAGAPQPLPSPRLPSCQSPPLPASPRGGSQCPGACPLTLPRPWGDAPG